MTVTITATVQTGNRVLLAIAGLSSESPDIDRILEVRRNAVGADPVFSGPVRGTQDLDVTGDTVVIIDQEAPFASPVSYSVTWVREDLTTGSEQSNYVILTAPYPRFSDPLTGDYCDFTVEQWPTIEYEYGSVVVNVHGARSPSPVVVTGPPSAPTSQIVIRFDPVSAGGPLRLRELLRSGAVLLLRAPCATVEGYFSISSLSETRLTNDPSDRRRRVTLAVTHVTAPDLFLSAGAPTLEELADFEPGTLGDLASDFPTLRDIAVADLGA